MELVRALRARLSAHGGLPLVWIALSVVAVIPVWSQRLLPMLDAPNHMALASAWHHYHDPSWGISDFYSLRIRPVPYMLFYLALHLLMYACSIEVANKIFLSAYLLLFPLSMLALARALKRSPWLALTGFVLAFNQNWAFGFSSYMMSTALMYFALAALYRYLADGRRRDLAAVALLCLLTYFGHVMSWFIFGMCVCGLLLMHLHEWPRVWRVAVATLPTVVLAALAYRSETQDRSFMRHGDHYSAVWKGVPELIVEFPHRVLDLFPGRLDMVVFWVVAATVGGLILWRGTRIERDTNDLQRRHLLRTLLVLGLLYVLLPYHITKPMEWYHVDQRMPSLIAPLLALLPAFVPTSWWHRLLLGPIIASSIFLPLQLRMLYRGFSRRNTQFMSLVESIPLGQRTMVVFRGMLEYPASVEHSGDPATSEAVYWHFSCYPVALRGGYAPYLFDQGIPVRPRSKLTAPGWSMMDSFDLRQAPDFDYYLVRFAPQEMAKSPALKLLSERGEWTLFKRTANLGEEP